MGDRYLSDIDLEEYWQNFTGLESEDEENMLDDDSLDDPDFEPDADDDILEEILRLQSNKEKSQEDAPSSSTPTALSETAPKLRTVQKNIIWKQKHLQLNEEQLRFHGNCEIHGDLLQLDTPYQFFCYFFSDELFRNIVEQTNLYYVQKHPERPVTFTASDIKQYIGIILYMSLVHMPNTRSYWNGQLMFSPISNTMSINKFEKLRQFIHFNDNSQFITRSEPGHDRLHKIRPLIDFLNAKFNAIPLEEHLSIDEQMCSTKVRHFMKQYMPMKPHKWGFKFFVLSGISGFAYNFEIYSGQENNITRPVSEPDLGATSNIVLRLSRIIPRNKNYRLYHDNYYTAIPLMVHLAKEGIYSLGTIRRNRLPNCKLPTEASMKKVERGTSHEFVASVDGVDISSLLWKDNKYVTLLSSFAGTHPEISVKRYDRKKKETVQVKCPNVIQQYNRHMGGVDLLDSLMGRYKISIKSRKWYIRIFYHLIDLTMVNAWLAYKRVQKQNGIIESQILEQAKFRAEVAESLCKINSTSNNRGRPSLIEETLRAKKKRGPAQHVPPKDVRCDQMGHWPLPVDNKIRCKFPKCKGFSRTKCEKCGVALCLNKSKNCFKNFHTN